MFSIIIPTWNNLSYLKCCVESIRKNSSHQNQVVLHINDGSDGTLQWAKDNGIGYTHTPVNAGICIGVNRAAQLARHDYLVYMNDDMYVCPGWDKYLSAEISKLETDCFMLSATMIEPVYTGNRCVVVRDFGNDIETFREAELLDQYVNLEMGDWNGSTWPPTVVTRKYWFLAGGYSVEFSPGISSDDDFSMKMWKTGCRIFKGIGKSKVYHFQTKSTARVIKNNGRRQFLFKWGINQSTFNKHFLRRGTPYSGPLTIPPPAILKPELLRAWIKMKLLSNPF
ncbi:MAG TPA: glycosyltransferase [Bacteroidales bacterium]|nr:glycosyltransferase [Bacteroidales bacterium]